jgi:hypothetical protein
VKNDDEKTSEGLNQIFEIINAKGDTGELKQIIDKSAPAPSEEPDPS